MDEFPNFVRFVLDVDSPTEDEEFEKCTGDLVEDGYSETDVCLSFVSTACNLGRIEKTKFTSTSDGPVTGVKRARKGWRWSSGRLRYPGLREILVEQA